MRIRTGHKPEDWTPSIPASTGSSRLGGELVTGGPGAFELTRIAHRKAKDRDVALRGERLVQARDAKTGTFVASRAPARGYNTVVGVSDDSATMRDDAASGAYSTGGRVAAYPRGVRP